MVAKCLRCGAGNEWIEGRVAPEGKVTGKEYFLEQLKILMAALEKEGRSNMSLRGHITKLKRKLAAANPGAADGK